MIEYKLSDKDVAGLFLDKVPAKLDDMQGLRALSYGSAREKIAEQFHMSEELLAALNSGKRFDHPVGANFVVQGVSERLRTKAAKLEIDKSAQTLRALDKDGKLMPRSSPATGRAAGRITGG